MLTHWRYCSLALNHRYTVECRYNVVQYDMILQTVKYHFTEAEYKSCFKPQKTRHSSSVMASYGVSFARIWEKKLESRFTNIISLSLRPDHHHKIWRSIGFITQCIQNIDQCNADQDKQRLITSYVGSSK